jgi:N-acetylglucosaminyl-diphospho-decaprenol L-rhamnosyltransferase
MRLSIIIVNYNVKYFLEQCLCSVEKALRSAGLAMETPAAHLNAGPGSTISQEQVSGMGTVPTAEVFVVDNHSSDGSAEWLPGRFSHVQFILNTENKGFAVANNQALVLAKGEYVLFLNPDTILPEDSFSICLSFMASHPSAGAVGLRMIDGGGRFLKESRRGFPTPWVAFCKLAGLTALFPHSAFFAGYYLGQLPSNEDHPSPILPGAYMFVRKQALEKTGGFDERFFLYAEDIDLSYRIEQAGYSNYYIAATTILHFKGESTPKDARYIKLFYKAMSQFRRKHSRSGGAWFNFLLEPAIWIRAGMQAIATRLRALISSRNSATAPDPAAPPGPPGGNEFILCEGPALSFKEIISYLETRLLKPKTGSLENEKFAAIRMIPSIPPDAVCMIHGSGTASAVGSASKDQRGKVVVL